MRIFLDMVTYVLEGSFIFGFGVLSTAVGFVMLRRVISAV